VPGDPVEADFAEYLEAVDSGRTSVVPLSVVAGRVAEVLAPGPDLAGWLAAQPTADLEDGALPGAAAAYRRLAAWAQAGELAAVAQLASRSAAADREDGAGPDGRPERITADACAQVSLALTMSQSAAQWWTGLAMDLQWRLPATGLALREGTIDLSRARVIVDATASLDDDKARAVEARVLPKASDQTTGQLRASVRRAVITVDPEGAERRREEAERQARVMLYPDPDGTASLSGQRLNGIRAAAAMARITALARALKADGADGGIDLLRSKVFIGLLLGTLPYLPPPPGGLADTDCPPGTDPGNGPGGNGPGGNGPGGNGPVSRRSADDDDASPHLDDWPWNDDQAPVPGPTGGSPADDPSATDSRQCSELAEEDRAPSHDRLVGDHCQPDDPWSVDAEGSPWSADPGGDPWSVDAEGSPWSADAGGDPWSADAGSGPSCAEAADPPSDRTGRGSVPWPECGPFVPPAPAALKDLLPTGSGFLDLRLPWSTLSRGSPEPGYLTRLGPITPAQARYLAVLAARDPGTEWRVVLTNDTGQAIALARARPRPSPDSPARAGPGLQSSLLRRVTVTIATVDLSDVVVSSLDTSTDTDGTGADGPGGGGTGADGTGADGTGADGTGADGSLARVLAAIVTAAGWAAGRADELAAADAAAGGCAHAQASEAYQVPGGLREFVNVRDLTCRFPTCRQPAWRCDADHTRPFDQGGPTCSCNLGALCRWHHKLKQHAQWRLDQAIPGIFTWTTSVGRTYIIEPDQQAA
jgi:hypothetical protein